MTITPSSIYSDIGISTEVMSASSHRLIQLLFEKCMQQMQLAKEYIKNNERVNRNDSIAKANDIIIYLRSCLNIENESTKQFSAQLDSTYLIIQKCLLNAMLKNDIEYLELATMMLTNIKSGWDQIG